MSKWFEVKVSRVTVFAIEVDDDEEGSIAEEIALGEVSGSWDDVETSKAITDPVEIDRLRRHADEVFPQN